MLKIKDLTAKYEKETVISNLSYEFEDKKKYAIIGPSGIGKTTLLNILCGLKKPNDGKVETSFSCPAYVFQDPRLYPWLTAIENVTLVCNDRAYAEKILLSLLGDKEALSKYPHELSGGMKQRVAVARAICYDGDVLFLDEPFRGLDPEMKQTVRQTLFDHSVDKTMIMITHDPSDAESCDVILKMTGSPVTELTEQ